MNQQDHMHNTESTRVSECVVS